jgi:hypothetical protein
MGGIHIEPKVLAGRDIQWRSEISGGISAVWVLVFIERRWDWDIVMVEGGLVQQVRSREGNSQVR